MAEYVINDKRVQTRMIAIVAASAFMFSIDYSMLNISLPSIANHFGVTLGVITWLPLVYLLIVTSTLLGFGKLGDTKGLKAVFTIGLIVFLAGTILCSIASNAGYLIAARALQSLGEAMFSPVGVAMLTTFLPPRIKGRALGIVALAQGLGLTLGNFSGGYINTHFAWRAIFLVNVPFAVLTIAASLKFLPAKQPEVRERGFDFPGTILIFAAASTLIYAMNAVGKRGLADPVVLGCLAVSVAAFTMFIFQEKRAPYPLLDLTLFRNRDFAFANFSALLLVSMLIGTGFTAPFMLEMVRGLSVLTTGIFLAIPSLMMLLLAPAAGWLADKIGSRILCASGAALGALSFIMLSFIGKDSSLGFIALSIGLLGFGAGIFLAPNNRLVMIHAPQGKQGVASGVYKICLNIGSVFGIAALPLIIMRTVRAASGAANIKLAEIKNSPDLMAPGFHGAFLFAAFVCAAAFLFALAAKDKKE